MNPKLTERLDIDSLASAIGVASPEGKEFLRISLENVLLFEGKHQDYGPRNISGFGTFGVVVRMNDKFERIKNLFNSGRRRRAINESIRDSFRDISNYAIIAYMVETGKWPK